VISSLHPDPDFRSHLTLVLCTILHAFTHAYATMLVPMYLLVQKDLGLPGVAKVSWIVTLYGVVYFIGSYFAGIAADRFDRKLLLGLGLLGNAVAITLMGLTHRYELLVVLAVIAGIAGTFFHPAANALVPAHYPKNPGMAIGLLGIGSGLGFWVGPQFAGWRSQAATWQFAGVSDWQRPLVEAGIAGLVIGVVFLLIAKEAERLTPSPRRGEGRGEGGNAQPSDSVDSGDQASNGVSEYPHNMTTHVSPLTPALSPRGEREPRPAIEYQSRLPINPRIKAPLGRHLTIQTLLVAFVLGFRDLAGVAAISLSSIFLLKAYGQSAARVGFVVGTMMLSATIVNPLLVWLTPGKRRLPSLAIILLLGGAIIATLPHWPLSAVLPLMCGFMTMQLGSYAVSDAAMLERVPNAARGRVTGLFLLWAGTLGSTGPWIMGRWTDHMGEASHDPHAYTWPFLAVAIGMWIAAACPPLIARLGKVGVSPPIDPFTETTPATMSAVG